MRDVVQVSVMVQRLCHVRGDAQLAERGIAPLADEDVGKALPGFLCMREPIKPWRPIVQPVSHSTRAGGCAVELTDAVDHREAPHPRDVDRTDRAGRDVDRAG